MPREGWKTVAIRAEYFEQLEEQADRDHRSVAGYLEKLLLDKKIVKRVEEVPAA